MLAATDGLQRGRAVVDVDVTRQAGGQLVQIRSGTAARHALLLRVHPPRRRLEQQQERDGVASSSTSTTAAPSITPGGSGGSFHRPAAWIRTQVAMPASSRASEPESTPPTTSTPTTDSDGSRDRDEPV